MRVLLTTRGSSGHVLPLAPFGHACLRAGHQVLVTAQRHNEGNVVRTGLACAPVDGPPDEEWMPLLGDFGRRDVDSAHAAMIREFFARMDTAAALPGMSDVFDDWRPDVVVRESWEFASTLLCESRDVPLAQVGLGLAGSERGTIASAAPPLDVLRDRLGLAPDPAGARLAQAPYLTTVPAALEDASAPGPERTHRYRVGTPDGAAPLPDPWPEGDIPLVYVSFGSVAAGAHLPFFPELYRATIEALAPLPVRVLVTLGEDRPLADLGPLPPNVRVERWVPQDAILPRAAAVVCHGGHGSVLGALSHGVPLVVLPLFSGDQWDNAAAVARAGAGVGLDADRATRRVLDRPRPETFPALAGAVKALLGNAAFGGRAREIARSMAALPPVDAAVGLLEALAERRVRAA